MTQTASQASFPAHSWPPAPANRPASAPRPDRAREVDVLQDALGEMARELGFQGGVYVHIGHAVRGLDRGEPITPLRFVASSVFDRRFNLEAGGLVFASAPARALQGGTPFAWTTAPGPSLTDAQRQLNARLRARGIHAGVIAPVQDYAAGPAYLNLYSTFAGEAERQAEAQAANLALAASRFHDRAKVLIPALSQTARTPLLTSREIDCLRLAALGLTAQETAEALEVTVRTVEFHLKNAAEKFGASNKVRAVALAVSQGLIEP